MDRYVFVIPYRNRPNCLEIFLKEFPAYVRTQSYISSFSLLVIEQEQGKPFNLGKLIDIGFDQAKKKLDLQTHDRFIFHPVDAIPLAGNFEVPEGSALITSSSSSQKKEQLGGFWSEAHGFRADVFEKVNGYPTEYWGWGCEDNDLFIRLDIHKVPIVLKLFEYRSLMGHGDEHSRDLDVSDVQTVNYLKNRPLLDRMIKERNPLISGLNTLAYKVVEESTRERTSEISHIVVSI